MRRVRHIHLGLILPLAAVPVFAVLLLFSLFRMVEVQNAMRVGAEQNMLWVFHQGDVAAIRLTKVVALAELGEAGQDDIGGGSRSARPTPQAPPRFATRRRPNRCWRISCPTPTNTPSPKPP